MFPIVYYYYHPAYYYPVYYYQVITDFKENIPIITELNENTPIIKDVNENFNKNIDVENNTILCKLNTNNEFNMMKEYKDLSEIEIMIIMRKIILSLNHNNYLKKQDRPLIILDNIKDIIKNTPFTKSYILEKCINIYYNLYFNNYIENIFYEFINYIEILIFNNYGCILIQLLLDNMMPKTAYIIINTFKNIVSKAALSMNGNYVLQKIITLFDVDMYDFIFEELDNDIFKIMCHNIGCRIIIRLIEYHSNHNLLIKIIDKIINYYPLYINNEYFGYIIYSVIKYMNNIKYINTVAEILYLDIEKYALQKKKCKLIELVMSKCSNDILYKIFYKLVDLEVMKKLILSQYSYHIARIVIKYYNIKKEDLKILLNESERSIFLIDRVY